MVPSFLFQSGVQERLVGRMYAVRHDADGSHFTSCEGVEKIVDLVNGFGVRDAADAAPVATAADADTAATIGDTFFA
jgi:hypothetical protein